ncbi:hypothetical protein KDL45_10560 [bacterium]|nr:hypothetical protein [bacterium]
MKCPSCGHTWRHKHAAYSVESVADRIAELGHGAKMAERLLARINDARKSRLSDANAHTILDGLTEMHAQDDGALYAALADLHASSNYDWTSRSPIPFLKTIFNAKRGGDGPKPTPAKRPAPAKAPDDFPTRVARYLYTRWSTAVCLGTPIADIQDVELKEAVESVVHDFRRSGLHHQHRAPDLPVLIDKARSILTMDKVIAIMDGRDGASS